MSLKSNNMLDSNVQTKFGSVNFYISIPEGKATIIINEVSPGQIYNIHFLIGKAGSLVNAWAYALAEITTALLHHTQDINSVIAMLKDISSDRSVFTENVECRSGPEALYLVLMRYKNMYKGRNGQ